MNARGDKNNVKMPIDRQAMIGGFPYFQRAGGRTVTPFSTPEKQTGFLWQNMGESGQMPLQSGQYRSVEANPDAALKQGVMP